MPRSSLRPFDVEWASTCARLRRPPCRLTAAQLRAVPVFQNNPRCARLTPGCRPTCARRTPARAVLQLLTTLLHSHSMFGGWRNAARAIPASPCVRARAFCRPPLSLSRSTAAAPIPELARHLNQCGESRTACGRKNRGAGAARGGHKRARARACARALDACLPPAVSLSSRFARAPCAARVQHNHHAARTPRAATHNSSLQWPRVAAR